MILLDLQKKLDEWKPVFLLEKMISHRIRLVIKKILSLLVVVTFVLSSGIVAAPVATATGFFFLILFFWTLFAALDAMYYSYYFKEGNTNTFELAYIILESKNEDPLRGFIHSKGGRKILHRLGVDDVSLDEFLRSNKQLDVHFDFPDKMPILESYFSGLVQGDEEFRNFLLAHGVTEEMLIEASRWVFDLEKRKEKKTRWWGEEEQRKISSIGKDWSYGEAYSLSRWSFELRPVFSDFEELHSEQVNNLENILSRGKGVNVLLVGEEGSGKMGIIESLGRRIGIKKTTPFLIQKKILILDSVALAAGTGVKIEFERTLIKIFNDAVKAGNIILVIPDFSTFVEDARALEADIEGILNEYLESPSLLVVATSDIGGYQRVIEPMRTIATHFDTIMVKTGDERKILQVLEEEIINLENEQRVLFSFGALREAIVSAQRYFVDNPTFDMANSLLVDSAIRTRKSGRTLVLRDDILATVKSKTGVPTGEIDSEERKELMNLEELLHARIVGQNEAIRSVSDALRRARSGIGNPKRPMGSFLFLGPTGVGKTETTKALAEIFFGQNAKILRLDMSEYNTADSLTRLIGAFDGESPGVLTSMIRENPYGVLLLDEFEKTERKVLDLFLQILDEGMFSDVLGRKVNARNLLIIATSNAGSRYIFETMQKGGNLLDEKEKIIEHIIHDGVFKPELLNRFDGIILFHPLSDENLRDIAKFMLKRLEWKLKEKGVTLIVNDILINFLVKKGSDPKFGARPLNRAIQDTVEKIIADKIIAGELKPGSGLEFFKSDLK